MIEHEIKARDAMIRQGYEAPVISFDGRIRRFGKNKSQWSIFYSDNQVSWGAYGDWRTGEKHSFCSKSNKEMTHQERVQYDERKRKIDKQIANDRAEKAKQAKLKAAKMLDMVKQIEHE